MTSEDWPQRIIMRTPIRIDFDPENSSETHPLVHMHMQDKDCRIAVNQPICFNSFVQFIFENYYNKEYKKCSLFKQLSKVNLGYKNQKQQHQLFLSFDYR